MMIDADVYMWLWGDARYENDPVPTPNVYVYTQASYVRQSQINNGLKPFCIVTDDTGAEITVHLDDVDSLSKALAAATKEMQRQENTK